MTTYHPKAGDYILTPEQLEERLRAERRATVERIRERLHYLIDASEPKDGTLDVGDLDAILDDEVARDV